MLPERYGSAFDTGVYAIEPDSLAALDEGHASSPCQDGRAELIRRARQRVWLDLNAGSFEPPRLPQVAAEVMRIAQQPDSSLAEVTRLLHQDPFLAGSVLRAANAAFYAPRNGRRITQLQRAVARLGLDRTRDIVLSVALRQTIYRGRHAALMSALWSEAIGVAVAMNLLAGATGKSHEQAFVIGLLHDVGRPVLVGVLEQVLEEMEGELAFEELAEEVFHLMHARAGAAIITGWGLPRSFAALVDHHHDPVPPPPLQQLAEFLRLATLIYEVWQEEGEGLYGCERLLSHPLVARLDIGQRQLLQVLALYPGALEGMMTL
jgi:HD-like signal output (HDOD) protein